ncbi:MAG: cadherin-like beta sandwich domain-containing protein [Thermoflexaceae bacterium]|nr:cadherin-like beta sandwich domain-containing protein [Thermoflexaceae bacterium]
MKKRIFAFLMVLFVLLIPNTKVYAAAVNVNITGGATTVGGETEVTVTLSNQTEEIGVLQLCITYDPAVVEAVSGFDGGGGGKIFITSTEIKSSYTIKFKGTAAGTSTIAVSQTDSKVYALKKDANNQDQLMEVYAGTGSVEVKGTANQSKNNNLSALTVSPGTLTPAFSKDVTTYNITLTESCSRLTVSATPEDSKARISVWGAAMDPGDNTTKITVTAENGDTKVYTIYTKVPEAPKVEEKPIIIDIDGALYNVISNFDEELLPEGYEAVDYTYKGKKIVVGKGISNGKIIFCVSDASVEKADQQFVVYDEQTGSFSNLLMITTKGSSYTVVESLDALNSVTIPEGFVESEYTLNNVKYKVWVDANNESAQYFIIYCTNVNGESGWYQYDILEGTMQRAFLNGFTFGSADTTKPETIETQPQTTEEPDNEKNGELQAEYDNYVKKTRLALGLMAFLLVAVVIIVVIFTVKSFHDSHEEYDEEEEEAYEEDDRESKETRSKKTKNDDDDDFTFIG